MESWWQRWSTPLAIHDTVTIFESVICVNRACITWLAYSDISRGQTIHRIWFFMISKFHIAYIIDSGFEIERSWWGKFGSSSSSHIILCWSIQDFNFSAEDWFSALEKKSEKSSALRIWAGVSFSSNEYANIFCVWISIFYHVIINYDNRIRIYFLITRLNQIFFWQNLNLVILSKMKNLIFYVLCPFTWKGLSVGLGIFKHMWIKILHRRRSPSFQKGGQCKVINFRNTYFFRFISELKQVKLRLNSIVKLQNFIHN